MKTVQTIALSIALLTLVSCQSTNTSAKDLSNSESRNEIMTAIANDSTMSNEMIGAMINSKNGMMMLEQHKMMTMDNNTSMMNMMKGNPAVMQSMMSAMMQTANNDTIMMSGMIKTMSENPQMMQMMQNMMGNNSMMGNNRMNGMKHKGGMAN